MLRIVFITTIMILASFIIGGYSSHTKQPPLPRKINSTDIVVPNAKSRPHTIAHGHTTPRPTRTRLDQSIHYFLRDLLELQFPLINANTTDGEEIRERVAQGQDMTIPPGIHRFKCGDRNGTMYPSRGQTIRIKAGAVLIWELSAMESGKYFPLFLVNAPDVSLIFEPGSLILVDGRCKAVSGRQAFGLPGLFACSVIAVLDHGHRFHCDGLTVRSTGDYCSAVYVVNADNGALLNTDLQHYSIGIRLTNRSIKGWLIEGISGDFASQSYNVHGGPGHLIYSLTADNLTIRNVYEGPHCLNNRLGEMTSYGVRVEKGKTGHTVKVSHAHNTYAIGLTIEGLHSLNRSGPLILGGGIDGAIVRGSWSSEEEPLIGPYSPLLKLREPNLFGLQPRNLDVKIVGLPIEN